MKIKLIAIVLVLVTTLAACTSPASKDQEETTALSTVENNTARQLPAFKLQDAQGNVVDMNSFGGKKVFVNLWASWCPPCRREMPSIAKLYQSVDKEKAVFIMLALDDDFEKSKKYMQKEGLNMPAYYPAEGLPELFNVPGIPATFIFNEQGQLIEHVEGSDNYDSEKYRTLLGS